MDEKVRPEDLTLHETNRNPRYLSLGFRNVIYVLVAGGLLYFGADLLPNAVGGWVTVIGGVFLLISIIPVAKFNRRVYQLPHFFIRNIIRRTIHHNRRWTQRSIGFSSHVAPEEERKRTKESKRSDLPIRVVRFGDMGTVVNEEYRMITFLVNVSGTDITTKTIAKQKAFNDRVSDALRFMVAAVRKYNPWIGFVFRSRPDNMYDYERNLRRIIDKRVQLPFAEEKPEEEWDEDDYINSILHQVVVQEGMEQIQSLTNPEMLWTFTVRYSRRFERILNAARKAGQNGVVKFEHKHLIREPVMRCRDAVMPLLSDIYTGEVRVLNFDEVIMYLRKAHDLKISEYYLKAYLAENRGESMPSTSWMPEGYIDEYYDKVNINGSWHATMFNTTFPDQFALPYTARDFYTPRTTYFTAVNIGRITKGNHRYRGLEALSGISDGARDFFGISKSGPKAHEREKQMYNTLSQLNRSGWAATYQPMITVSKTSEYELEKSMQYVDSRLDGALFGPQRLVGESEQWEQFFVASTGIPLQF